MKSLRSLPTPGSTMADAGSMLLISLGPIQDFIRSARRCQDLWFCSWLLSDLARTVGESVQSSAGNGVVVFPAGLAAAEARGERPGVSNVIFAVLPASVSPRRVAEDARTALATELDRVAEHVFQNLSEGSARQYFHSDVARTQLHDLMEFSWVSVPRTTSGYALDRQSLYERLAALKNTKTWTQPGWSERAGVPKSSLDGERESVVDESIFAKNARGETMGATQRRRHFGLKGMERLCGVGLLKRLGHDLDQSYFRGSRKPAFHSTSNIAAGPLLNRIEAHGEDGERAVKTYIGRLQDAGLDVDRFKVGTGGALTLAGHDGSLLFPSRMKDHFTENFLGEKPMLPTDEPYILERAQKALAELMDAVDGPAEPLPYYAYLLADGDNMGAAIDNIGNQQDHVALAAALNAFAGGCRKIVEEHQGTLIFSGGDDVLALLPLHQALACSRALASEFKGKVGRYKTQNNHSPTLSVGLAISHCREPMSEARALAERAEKMAKSHPGKNALAVIVAKRSGGDLALVGSWDEAEGRQPPDKRLLAWMTELADGELSGKAAHDLDGVATHYEGLPPHEQHTRVKEIKSLCRQVLARKRTRGGGEAADQDMFDALLAPLDRADSGLTPALQVRRMSEELQIARLFQSAAAEAESPPSTPHADPQTNKVRA